MELVLPKQIGLGVDLAPTTLVSMIVVIDVQSDLHLRCPGVRKMLSREMMAVWRTNFGLLLLGEGGHTIWLGGRLGGETFGVHHGLLPLRKSRWQHTFFGGI